MPLAGLEGGLNWLEEDVIRGIGSMMAYLLRG